MLYRIGLQRHFSDEFVWDRAFRDNNKKWVIIDLKDGSKLVGFAKWYSQKDQKRTLCLGEAELRSSKMVGKIKKKTVTEFDGDYLFLNFDEVRAIQFRS